MSTTTMSSAVSVDGAVPYPRSFSSTPRGRTRPELGSWDKALASMASGFHAARLVFLIVGRFLTSDCESELAVSYPSMVAGPCGCPGHALVYNGVNLLIAKTGISFPASVSASLVASMTLGCLHVCIIHCTCFGTLVA